MSRTLQEDNKYENRVYKNLCHHEDPKHNPVRFSRAEEADYEDREWDSSYGTAGRSECLWQVVVHDHGGNFVGVYVPDWTAIAVFDAEREDCWADQGSALKKKPSQLVSSPILQWKFMHGWFANQRKHNQTVI